MLFNSGLFLQFFGAFLLLYYIVRKHLDARNWLIVLASFIFYGAWDYRFLTLLAGSSLLDFYIGRALEKENETKRRKRLLWLSMAGNLGALGFFKYCDFFLENFQELLAIFQISTDMRTLGIILPVGISFYTFQTMSYTIDVYRRQIPAERKLVNFMAFVAFFPQLVAGPIERASHLLPQFASTRTITREMVRQGVWLCLWGMFKKVVIADNLAPLVEMVYGNPDASGVMVALGTVAFALQIYGDFSGYSDIARGTARILGFDIMLNFNLPYMAGNLREFWRRWHISLSTWLRDYLYISLGGNRRGKWRNAFTLLATMLLGGLWHGPQWTFVLWGAWHGMGLIAQRAWSGPGRESRSWSPLGWALTAVFVLYGWLLFRADSLRHIVQLTKALGDWSIPAWFGSYVINLLVFSLPLIAMQIWQHLRRDLLVALRLREGALGALEGVLLIAIILYWEKEKAPFIYFQF